MEGRKGSRALRKTVYSVQKRLLAFALAAAMILTNVGADLNTAYAASSSESVTFEMSGSQLVDAIEEAIANGNEVTAEDFDFTNGKIAEFEKLFFGEGRIYEAFPEAEGGSMDAELRVFVRLPEDADDMYMVTGDEEVIFLYINNGEDTISCTTEITRMDDGVEKVKKTKRVTVKSYEAAYGDEEVNLISKPVEETTAPEETQGPATGETTAPTGSQVETTAPAEGETTVPGETDETTAPPAETDAATAAPEESTAAPSEGETAAPEESQTEAETEAETEAATTEAAEEKTQEADEPEETEAPETDAPETEAPEKSGPVASIVRHFAPVVAENEIGEAADADEPKEEAPEKEEADAPKEKEDSVKDKADAVEDNKAADEEKTTEAPETSEAPETKESPEETTEATTQETTTAADGETTVPGTEESTDATTAAPAESSSAADSSESSAEVPSESATVPDTATSSDAKETTEASKVEDNVSKAGTSDLVGMGYCSTAKVYTTTINQLKALEDFDGYKVSYAFYPEASGRIVEGPRGVKEGESLTFGVKNQIGYAVDSVTANGEMLEADSVTDNGDGECTVWYSVPGIYEEQEIEVYMIETDEHPAVELAPIQMEDGVTIHIRAEEGVLPQGVTAVASIVTGIEDVVKENVEANAAADGEQKEVVASFSYNIDLMLGNKKLDNEIWDGSVQVTFSGVPIEEKSREADAVEVMYVATTKEEELQADVSESDVVAVESVTGPVDVAGDASVGAVEFEAEHFSVYTVTFTKNNSQTRQLSIHVMAWDDYKVTEFDYNKEVADINVSEGPVSIEGLVHSETFTDEASGKEYAFSKATTIGSNYETASIMSVSYNNSGFYGITSDGKTVTLENDEIFVWYIPTAQTVMVKFILPDGMTSSGTIPAGYIAENVPVKAGYKFDKAVVNGPELKDVVITYVSRIEDTYYYNDGSLENADISYALSEGDEIHIYYKAAVEEYPINYDKKDSTNNPGNIVDGPSSVEKGSAVDIKVDTAVGYKVTVSVSGKPLTPTNQRLAEGTKALANQRVFFYRIDNVMAAQNVTVNFEKINQFTFFVEKPYEIYYHKAEFSPYKSEIERSGELKLTLTSGEPHVKGEPYNGYYISNHDCYDWQLNSFQINGIDIKVPNSWDTGASQSDTLYDEKDDKIADINIRLVSKEEIHAIGVPIIDPATGSLTMKKTGGLYQYTYEITFSNVYTNINVTQGNFRESLHHEVMPTDISEGIEAFYQWKGDGDWTEVKGSNPIGFNDGNTVRDREFKYSIKKGYGPASVRLDGSEIKVEENEVFSIGVGDKTYRTLEITNELLNYKVEYHAGLGNTGIPKDINKYDIVKNNVVYIPSSIPLYKDTTRTFLGWSLTENASEPDYTPNSAIDLLELIQDKDDTIHFYAVWSGVDVPPVYLPVVVKFYKQSSAGGYEEEIGDTINVSGIPSAKLLFNAAPYTEKYEGYVYNPNKSKTVIRSLSSDDNVIELYYDCRGYKISYDLQGGVLPEGRVNPFTYTKFSPDITLFNPEKEGFTFEGWSGTGITGISKNVIIPTGSTGDRHYQAHFKEANIGVFKVWSYIPEVKPGEEYGYWIEGFGDSGNHGGRLTYNASGNKDQVDSKVLDINAVNAILKSDTESLRDIYPGARVKEVYLVWMDSSSSWEKNGKQNAVIKEGAVESFPALTDGSMTDFQVFHGKGETRLHICYEIPRVIQVEYWKRADNGTFVEIEDEHYTIGESAPNYVYDSQGIQIKGAGDTGDKNKDILKVVPASAPGYEAFKAVYIGDKEAPDGNEEALMGYTVKNTAKPQRIGILLETKLDVTASGFSGGYDGKYHAAKASSNKQGAEIEYSTDGGITWGTVPPSIKNVGSVTVRVKASLEGYESAETVVSLNVTPAPVTVTAENREKQFGTSDPAFGADVEGLVNGEDKDLIEYKLSRPGAGTDEKVGNYPGAIVASGERLQGNYSVTYKPGDFEITDNTTALTVIAEDGGGVYNGKAYHLNNVRASLEGAKIEYQVNGGGWSSDVPGRTGAGSQTVKVRAVLEGYKTAESEVKKIEVTPAPVTITVTSTFKDYGQKDPVFTGSVEGLIDETDLGSVTYGRIAEDAGKENVGDSIRLTAYYTANENYEVTVIPGSLTIVASGDNAVAVTGREVTYDGKAYGLSDVQVAKDDSTLYYSTDNVTFTEEAPVFTEAGVYVVYVKAVHPNYADTEVAQGKIIINKRAVTFMAESASKKYDGTPLTADSAAVSSGSIADGQTWAVTVTGSQTSVGTSKNIVSGAVIKDGDRDVTANYDISYVSGDLTVTSSEGGSTGGGGTGGGNTGGGGGNRYTPPEGGPGAAAVTITPEEVPLAQLPGTPVNATVIDDGEIPLAALPKTGQGSVRSTLTMMMSGIFLILVSIGKKRKEENS